MSYSIVVTKLCQSPAALPIVLIIYAAEPLSREAALMSPSSVKRLSSTVRPVMVFCWLFQEFLPANLCLEAPQTFPYAQWSKELTRLSCGSISKHASPKLIKSCSSLFIRTFASLSYYGSTLNALIIILKFIRTFHFSRS